MKSKQQRKTQPANQFYPILKFSHCAHCHSKIIQNLHEAAACAKGSTSKTVSRAWWQATWGVEAAISKGHSILQTATLRATRISGNQCIECIECSATTALGSTKPTPAIQHHLASQIHLCKFTAPRAVLRSRFNGSLLDLRAPTNHLWPLFQPEST